MVELHPTTVRIFSGAVTLIALTNIFVALRLVARRKARQFSYLSDGLCLVSLSLFCAFAGLMIYYLVGVARGDPFMPVTMEKRIIFLKILYVEQVLFTFDISVVKLSILAFYWNVFGVDRRMKTAILSITAACIVWWIVFTFLAAFRCRPPTHAWQPSAPQDTCVQVQKVFVPLESTNLVLDIVVLCVPIFTIGKLNLSTKKKVSVIGIFLLGVSVCVASVARIVGMTQADHASMFFWSAMQLGLAIVCSCLPLLGSLVRPKKKLNSYPRSSDYPSFRSRTGRSSGYKMTGDGAHAAGGPWADSTELQGTHVAKGSRDDEHVDSDDGVDVSRPRDAPCHKEASVV